MNLEAQTLSDGFRRLYCDAAVFEGFSAWHPISFNRVLPFQAHDPVADDARVIAAEEAHLASQNEQTRRDVVAAYSRSGLLSAEDVTHLQPALEDFGADFFEVMGEVHANAGQFICALRWQREWIAVMEAQPSLARPNGDEVYASVGYVLYSLGLFPEAIAWTKSCIGPDLLVDIIGAALTDYQAQLGGGRLLATERTTNRTRYTGSTQAAEFAEQCTPQLKAALKNFIPFQESYVNWISAEAPVPLRPAEGYPFRLVVESNNLPRHKMNLLFALVAQADDLSARGFAAEARRLLQEAVLLEPGADFVSDRIKALP